MTRAVLRREVDVAAPAGLVWGYVVDWPRQGEWIPQTRVERLDGADHVGGRLRAWTGLGPVGFWDTMTITAWEPRGDGGGRCEVLHTGRVVRGEGEFEVRGRGAGASTFVWTELLQLPGGRLAGLGWRLAEPVVARLVDVALRRMAHRAEALASEPPPR